WLDFGGGQDGPQEQPVAVCAAEQVGVLALPAQARPLSQRLLHQGGGVDEDLDLLTQPRGDLTGQDLQPSLDDLVIVVAARIDGDVARRRLLKLWPGVFVRTVVHAQDDGRLGAVPHGGGVGAALQRRLHPAHVAVAARIDEIGQPFARAPRLSGRGEAAHAEAQLGGALSDEDAGIGRHEGALALPALRSRGRRTRARGGRRGSGRPAGGGNRGATSAWNTTASARARTP